MNYKNRLQENNAGLQDILEKAQALPKATELPILDNPATAADIVKDKQVIGADGSVITGTVEDPGTRDWYLEQYLGHDFVNSKVEFAGMFDAGNGTVLRGENPMVVQFPASYLGNAAAGDVAAGKTFTSAAGLNVVGTAQAGGGGTTHTITLNAYDAEFSLWWADNAYTGLSTNDHPPTIEVVGDQMIAVFVRYMSAGVVPSGCVGWGSGATLMLDGSDYYGFLFFLHVSGSEPTGSIEIYGY